MYVRMSTQNCPIRKQTMLLNAEDLCFCSVCIAFCLPGPGNGVLVYKHEAKHSLHHYYVFNRLRYLSSDRENISKIF